MPTPRRLGRVLTALAVTRPQLARKVGVSPRTMTRWVMGHEAPSGNNLARLRRWLKARGVPPDLALEPDDMSDLPPIPPVQPNPAQETPMDVSSLEFLDDEDLAFFGLSQDPFTPPEEPDDIFLPPELVSIEKALLQAIQRRQIVAVCGDPGSGKSTLLRRIYGRVRNEKRVRLIAPASLDRRRITHAALGVAILRDLIGKDTSSYSMESRSELLRRTLEDQSAAGLLPALLIDEAHLLKADALLAVKQLWDSHTLFRQLAVILVGQLTLEGRLRTDPAVRELTGRTRILRVPSLGANTADYLRWRFARVHAHADQVFDPSGYQALQARAEYPLWCNNLAVNAMHYARVLGDDRVTAQHVGRS